ncbi:MAG: aldo/keto reductase [Lautropia sp.]
MRAAPPLAPGKPGKPGTPGTPGAVATPGTVGAVGTPGVAGAPAIGASAWLGIGTWRMGEAPSEEAGEVAALRAALDHGVTLIDTAEMYGDGAAETIVGHAIAGRRDDCYLVSKVLPHNASRRGTIAACERSLQRLGTDRIDLYLLHWRGSHPFADTVAAFRELVAAGKILRWGVSNFDVDDLAALLRLCDPGECAANQVYYSLSQRGVDFALVPLHRRHAITTMAYCPLDGGRLVRHRGLAGLAAELGVTAAQLALAWLLAQRTWAIPMTRSPARAAENAAARGIVLAPATLAKLDALFPAPTAKTPLMIV